MPALTWTETMALQPPYWVSEIVNPDYKAGRDFETSDFGKKKKKLALYSNKYGSFCMGVAILLVID